jgi:hypothetical protein
VSPLGALAVAAAAMNGVALFVRAVARWRALRARRRGFVAQSRKRVGL